MSLDENLFYECLLDDKYDVISIGHTHGNVTESIKNISLARNMSDGLRCKYKIRDTGLNISIADIWQHEAFKQIASGHNKKILQTIIMYNGEVLIIDNDGISKFNNIYKINKNNEIDLISTFDDEKKFERSNSR